MNIGQRTDTNRYELEVERDVARLEISARAGETSQARLILSRQILTSIQLVSSRLADLRLPSSSRFTSQKRDQIITKKLSRLARQ